MSVNKRMISELPCPLGSALSVCFQTEVTDDSGEEEIRRIIGKEDGDSLPTVLFLFTA